MNGIYFLFKVFTFLCCSCLFPGFILASLKGPDTRLMGLRDRLVGPRGRSKGLEGGLRWTRDRGGGESRSTDWSSWSSSSTSKSINQSVKSVKGFLSYDRSYKQTNKQTNRDYYFLYNDTWVGRFMSRVSPWIWIWITGGNKFIIIFTKLISIIQLIKLILNKYIVIKKFIKFIWQLSNQLINHSIYLFTILPINQSYIITVHHHTN